MDDDFDIYEDLPLPCEIKDNVTSSGINENVSKECEELKRETTELKTKLQKLQKINETLEVNLSSLLKTAKAEIARKDKMIEELRKQVDDMSFKRGYFKRNRREMNSKSVQQVPVSNTQNHNNVQPEYTRNSNIENNTPVNANQFDYDQDVSDYESFNNKHHRAKYRTTNFTESSKLSTTVFAERLRKRIIEEEEADQKKKLEDQEKQNLLLENNHENNKEINIDDKENQSHFSMWNSNVDNTNSKSKGTEHDYIDNVNSLEDTAGYIENQQRIVVSTKVSGRKTDDDTDMPRNKRRKLDIEQNDCTTKDYLPQNEDICNGYDNEIMSNKFHYKDNIDSCIKRNDPHYNTQTERDHSRSRSNDRYYKRKEHYKKSNSDYNYSKENTYYHEKDKYNHPRNRSPVLKYSDRKQKYHDDRHRDHRDKFDRRNNFLNKEEETPIISNKKFYDLRHKDKIKFNGKYNSTDFYSPRHKEIRYSDSRISRSVSHERSKSGSRERTNHKIYDKRSSKSKRTNNDLEKHTSISLNKRDETNKLKVSTRKKDDISEKSVKTNSTKSLESGKIIDNCPIKSDMSLENKSENESVSSKLVDVCTTNNNVFIKEENSINIECEKNENDTVQIATNVNINFKQDCENKLKCDEFIVKHGTVNVEGINTCDTIPNFPRSTSNSTNEISVEVSQKNDATDKRDVETEELQVRNKLDTVRNNCFSNEIDRNENNISKNKNSSAQNNPENRISTLNDPEEPPPVVIPQQKTEQDNNKNDHVKSKDSESKRKSENEKSRIIVLARRRKRVQLADNDASMTIVISANNTNADIDLKNNTENNLKSRACKAHRTYKNVL